MLPTTHAFAAGRPLIDGEGMNWGELGLAALTTAFAVVLSVWFLLRMLRLFRRRGYVTRFPSSRSRSDARLAAAPAL